MLDINEKDDLTREIDELHRARRSNTADSDGAVTDITDEDRLEDAENAAFAEFSDFSGVRNIDDLKKKFETANENIRTINQQTSDTPEKKKGSALGVIFIIIFLLGIGGIILFSDLNPTIPVFLFGLIFASVGLLAPTAEDGASKVVIALFSLVGIVIMALSGYVLWGPENAQETIEGLIPMLIAAFFFLIGVAMFVFPLSVKIKRSKKEYIEITAICSDLLSRTSYRKVNGHRRRVTTYCPVYTFYHGGTEYTLKENFYSDPCPVQEGDECKLFINPQNPTDFYSTLNSGQGILMFIGIVFIVVSVAVGVIFATSM